MKKTIITLLTLAVIACGYYVYKHKNRYVYKYDNVEINDYTERVRVEKDFEDLKSKYEKLEDNYEAVLNQNNDLDVKVQSMTEEIKNLRSQLEQKSKSEKTTASNTVKNTKKNEKTLPIARNSRAIELQRYLTELYGDR